MHCNGIVEFVSVQIELFPLNPLNDDSTILSTSPITSTFGTNVLLQGYHQPLTALRKLVEINRNVDDVSVNQKANPLPDVDLDRSSPISNPNNDEDGSIIGDDCTSSSRKRPKLSSRVDSSIVSTPDSMSSNSTSQSNTPVTEMQSKVDFFSLLFGR